LEDADALEKLPPLHQELVRLDLFRRRIRNSGELNESSSTQEPDESLTVLLLNILPCKSALYEPFGMSVDEMMQNLEMEENVRRVIIASLKKMVEDGLITANRRASSKRYWKRGTSTL
jgi:uncharacterized protein YihD (DUF1040 family)